MARYSTQHKKRRKFPPRKKKRSCIISAVAFVLVISLCIGAFFIFKDYLNDTKTKLEKITYPRKYSELVSRYSNEYGVEEAFIYSIIRTESGFDENAESYVGAKGLMQIMPDTFEWLQTHVEDENSYTENDLFLPETNIKYGTYFLSFLLKKYDGDKDLTAAAYNAGFNAVDGWLESPDYSSDGKSLSYIPYEETSNYVKKVSSSREMYIKLYYS